MPVVNTSAISEPNRTLGLETACRQARIWERAGITSASASNLSPSQLQSG